MKKQILSTALSTLLLAGSLHAEKGTVYISPNNDGVQDELKVPLQIKEKRYVSAWSFVVEDEKGNVIRTIGNKDKRPTSIGVKTFFKQLVTPKSGVLIPEEVIWNGTTDEGGIAPDGTYYYYLTASDDNDNTSKSKKFCVVVDNTAPEIELKQPSQDDRIFGEGAKSLFTVRQDGSVEDEWTGTFSDVNGKTVKTIKWTESAPLKFDWAGTNDDGIPVADGVYSYKVTATDKAGNVSNPAAITNIIYSAEKPATNISLVSGRYFSPNNDSINDTVNFEIKIPTPDKAKTGNALVEWAVKIVAQDGKAYRTYSGTDKPLTSIEFDGKDDAGNLINDGKYQARVTAKYLNGYETTPVNSPVFMLDTVSPKADIKTSSDTFGGGANTTLTITHTTIDDNGSPIKNWTGKISDASGTVVKEYNFGSLIPQSITWNGTDESNGRAKDGAYIYTLTASDAAGNSLSLASKKINLDTSKAELFISASPVAFNSTKTAVNFTPVVKAGSDVVEYTISVQDKNKKTVWSQNKKSTLPSSVAWNGLTTEGNRAPDGIYTVSVATEVASGAKSTAESQPFVIDNVTPSVELSVPYTLFSPDGDKNKDTIPVTAKTSNEDKWTIIVSDAGNKNIFTKTVNGAVSNFEWDGTDDAGNKAADGTYKIRFEATDAAGNSNFAEIKNVKLDSRETKAYLTTELDAFSPNGDSILDVQKFTIRTSLAEGIANWKFEISDSTGKVVRTWSTADQKDLPAIVNWDGTGTDGKVVADNIYSANLTLNYEKGNVVNVTSSAFISCVTAPELSVKTTPKFFSPDNDGENDDLYIQLKRLNGLTALKNWSFQINDPKNGKSFWKTSGKSAITERIIWDGRSNSGELVQSAMDYPYIFTATDELGLTSKIEGVINIDILVIRDDNVLKMAVPSIIFESDSANFQIANAKLDKDTISKNKQTLDRIAEILKKFKDYKIEIVGHANKMTDNPKEETEDNPKNWGRASTPLSKERADAIKAYLVNKGVTASNIKTNGKGGTEPVADTKNKDVNWKNRRVEFILNK